MKHLKSFESSENYNFDNEKRKIIKDLNNFLDKYYDFISMVSPKHWIVTHFSEMQKFIGDIQYFTEITDEEIDQLIDRDPDWAKWYKEHFPERWESRKFNF